MAGGMAAKAKKANEALAAVARLARIFGENNGEAAALA